MKMGGQVIGWNYNGLSPTLKATVEKHPPIVIYEDIDGEEIL